MAELLVVDTDEIIAMATDVSNIWRCTPEAFMNDDLWHEATRQINERVTQQMGGVVCRVTTQYWQGFSAVGEEFEPPVATENDFFGCYEDLVVMDLVAPSCSDEFERIMSSAVPGVSLGVRFSVCNEMPAPTPGSIAELYPRIAVPLAPEIPLLVERTAIAAELE